MCKTLGRSIAVLIFWSAVGVCQIAAWKEYKYADYGFAFTSPSQPLSEKQSTVTSIAEVELQIYSIDLGGDSGVMISVADFGKKGENVPAHDLLQAMKNGAVHADNIRLISEREISLDNNPGLEFEIADLQYHARAHYYSIKGKVIGLTSVAPASKPFSADANRILDSFRLLKSSETGP